MGFYIEAPPGQHHGKAKWIRDNLKGIYITRRPEPDQVPPGYVPVCVVDNGPFEAAAIAYDEREAIHFDSPTDYRFKQWLVIPISEAIKANREVQRYINWDNSISKEE